MLVALEQTVWTVTRENGEFSCDCPNSKFRGGVCKHIQQVKESLQ